MKVLITRPMADAVPFAKRLMEAGHEAVIEPMIRIRISPVTKTAMEQALEGVSGLVFTSANGVRAFCGQSATRHLTAWCVGRGSADAAQAAGFSAIETAGGDVELLAAHITARMSPEEGMLLHVAGSHRAGDLSALLGRAGYEMRRLVLYEAEARTALTGQTIDALRADQIDVLTLFSPRTARLFRDLAVAAGLETGLSGLTAVSLSKPVDAAFGLPVKHRVVAEDRHQDAMIAALNTLGA